MTKQAAPSTDKLALLMRLCKGEVSLEINVHRHSGLPIKEYLERYMDYIGNDHKDLFWNICHHDTLIALRFHPEDAHGYHTIIHYDLDQALSEALATFN